jgi:hypothetical protein
MNLVLHIPDDIAERLGADGDIERRALEAVAAEAYRDGRLTRAELRRMLGFEARAALDAFLVAHDIFGTYTEEDLADDRRDLKRAGF